MLYKFCPNCGGKNLEHQKDRSICNECNFIVYQNAAACASTLPIRDGKLLIAIRKNDPYKGMYDLIGGFVGAKESAEDAAIRETKEETGLDVKIVKLLGTYPDKYGDGGIYVLCIQFIVEVVGGEVGANDDVSRLEWISIKEIPNLKNIGFESAKQTLNDLYKQYSK